MDPFRIRARYRESGQRMTVQRQAVAAAVAGDRSHPSARQVLERVRRRFPSVAPATVYRILEELVAMGELQAIEADGGGRRYDPNPDPHAHLVCLSCGSLEDVSPENVRVEIAPSFTVERAVRSTQVTVQGFCKTCSVIRREEERAAAPSGVARNSGPS